MRTISAGATDVGKRRELNEDFFLCDDSLGLYIVADGVGGMAKGEIASQEAVEQVAMWVHRHIPDVDRDGVDDAGRAKIRRMLESGVQSACYMVFGLAEQDPEKRGMSTTMSVLLIRGGRAYVAQVGDSRVYRYRDGVAMQLTEDHTLINYQLKRGMITAEEAKRATAKNVITRAVGHHDYVQVDTLDVEVLPDDRFLLCTDGFHGYVECDEDVAVPLMMPLLEDGVRGAIDLALQRGGRDNITVLIAAVRA